MLNGENITRLTLIVLKNIRENTGGPTLTVSKNTRENTGESTGEPTLTVSKNTRENTGGKMLIVLILSVEHLMRSMLFYFQMFIT